MDMNAGRAAEQKPSENLRIRKEDFTSSAKPHILPGNTI